MNTRVASRAVFPPGGALLLAVVGVSWGGPLVRFSSAPALAISAWRLDFSVALILTVLLLRTRARSVRLPGVRTLALAVASGALLAGHFWAWVASIQLTTVASSTVLYSIHPFFVAALSAAFLAERPTSVQWLGISLAVVGAAVIAWGDVSLGSGALAGDALALLSGALAAGYFTIGRELRRKLDLWTYVGAVYGVAAVLLTAAVMASASTSLVGYPGRDWLVFLALAAGPMMVGHTGINYALRYFPAYIADLAALGEPVGATLIAWTLPAIGETPSVQTLAGGILVVGGIATGVLSARAEGSSGRGARAPEGTG